MSEIKIEKINDTVDDLLQEAEGRLVHKNTIKKTGTVYKRGNRQSYQKSSMVNSSLEDSKNGGDETFLSPEFNREDTDVQSYEERLKGNSRGCK